MPKSAAAGEAAAGSSRAAAVPSARHGRVLRLTITDQYLLQQLKVCRPQFFHPISHIFTRGARTFSSLPFSLPPRLPLFLSLKHISLSPFFSLHPPLLLHLSLISACSSPRPYPLSDDFVLRCAPITPAGAPGRLLRLISSEPRR